MRGTPMARFTTATMKGKPGRKLWVAYRRSPEQSTIRSCNLVLALISITGPYRPRRIRWEACGAQAGQGPGSLRLIGTRHSADPMSIFYRASIRSGSVILGRKFKHGGL